MFYTHAHTPNPIIPRTPNKFKNSAGLGRRMHTTSTPDHPANHNNNHRHHHQQQQLHAGTINNNNANNNGGVGSINRGIEFLRNAFFGYGSSPVAVSNVAASPSALSTATAADDRRQHQQQHNTSSGSSSDSGAHDATVQTQRTSLGDNDLSQRHQHQHQHQLQISGNDDDDDDDSCAGETAELSSPSASTKAAAEAVCDLLFSNVADVHDYEDDDSGDEKRALTASSVPAPVVLVAPHHLRNGYRTQPPTTAAATKIPNVGQQQPS